jgi:hypothetical protein
MKDFKTQYLDWLRENIHQTQIREGVSRITLPYLNRSNDMMDIYIITHDNGYTLTDDGETIHNLSLAGVSLEKGRRKELLNQILLSFGIKKDHDQALFTESSLSDLPLRKHMLSQCMLKIDDLFFLSKKNTKSVFVDDVHDFLDENEVRYIERASFTGKSGLPTMYDFSIPKSRKSPERNIKVVNHLTNDGAKSIIFGWTDTIDARKNGAKLFTFINDEAGSSNNAVDALRQYDITPILWSCRKDSVNLLIA